MKCKHCGASNSNLKKSCTKCNKILEGITINNATGKIGYRYADGSFREFKNDPLNTNNIYEKLDFILKKELGQNI